MKKFLVALGIVVISLAFVMIFKNLIIKSLVTTVVSRITGTPVHMDSFSLNILSSTIRVSGFKMYNPEGFAEGLLISCPKITVIYDRPSLFKHRLHFLLVDIELREMELVKNRVGRLNVDSLKIARQSKSSAPISMQVDILTLSIGKIIYKDYNAGAEPVVRVYDVNRRKSYKGIPTAQQLVLLVLAEPMKAAMIKNAEIYGVAMFTGAAILPVAVTGMLIGKDNVRQVVDASFEHMYKVSFEVLKRMGTITKSDASGGLIKANVNGVMIALMLRNNADGKTEITISGRKYMFPRLDIAGGVLYQILDKMQ